MFRHQKNKASVKKNDDKKASEAKSHTDDSSADEESGVGEEKKPVEVADDTVVEKLDKKDDVQGLLEKNLKWSQIIYEQNRKINNKLLWSAVASWLRLLMILIPLILAVFYLPTFLKDAWGKYGDILGIETSIGENITNGNSVNSLIDGLQIDSAAKEQIKAILR